MDSRFSCSICNSFASLNYASVIQHIGSVHAWEPRFRITCGIDGCIRKYTSYRCYREHIINKHSELLQDDSMDTEEPIVQDSEYVQNEEITSNDFDDSSIPEVPRPKLYNKALFLLKIKDERRLSQVAINGLIGDITTLLEENLSLKKDVIQCMQEENALAELIGTIFQKNNSCTI